MDEPLEMPKPRFEAVSIIAGRQMWKALHDTERGTLYVLRTLEDVQRALEWLQDDPDLINKFTGVSRGALHPAFRIVPLVLPGSVP